MQLFQRIIKFLLFLISKRNEISKMKVEVLIFNQIIAILLECEQR